MRVVHTFIKYPPAIGGHEAYVAQLATGLRARGVDARVATSTLRKHLVPRGPRRPSGAHRLAERLGLAAPDPALFLDAPYDEVDGVPVTRLRPRLPLSRRVELPGLAEALRALRPDVLHAHDIWRAPFETTIDVAVERDIPLLLNPVYHDRSGERNAGRWLRALRRTAAKVPERALVLFNTPWEEERLAAAGVRFARTALLPPSIDPAELDGVPDAPVAGLPAAARDAGRDGALIACVARFHPEKRIDLLVRAFAEALERLRASGSAAADRAHLVVAGHRDSDDDYATLATELGIADRVTLLEDRPRADIVNLLRRSAAFALPSACETFGIVVLEAWALDNLVLVSDRWALPRVVRDGEDGLVCADADWPAALARALEERETPWARQLVERGRRAARERHDRATRIDTLLGYLDDVAAR